MTSAGPTNWILHGLSIWVRPCMPCGPVPPYTNGQSKTCAIEKLIPIEQDLGDSESPGSSRFSSEGRLVVARAWSGVAGHLPSTGRLRHIEFMRFRQCQHEVIPKWGEFRSSNLMRAPRPNSDR